MAEIRSTLDMVMERAARMAAEADGTDKADMDDSLIKGMKFAAAFLNNDEKDLVQLLNTQAPEEQMGVRSGMAKTLLRNILLPREETISDLTLLSLKTLQELSGNSADVSSICSELNQMLEQYGQHKQQVRQQFDESILGQLKTKLQQQGMAVDDEMALNPTMHPQYQEEWSKVSADLNGQYSDAIEQRKVLIEQRFGL